MFNIVLYQPEIPPNTGNIIRLCANTGAILHLVHPLGFDLDDKQLRRAGLDYAEWAQLYHYPDIESCLEKTGPGKNFAISTKGNNIYSNCHFNKGDTFIFGPETRGLPASFLESLPTDHVLRIPMQAYSRSLNLSNAVSIILYEAWRQNNFAAS